jgi:peptide/nickel transport system substrate-binding protein
MTKIRVYISILIGALLSNYCSMPVSIKNAAANSNGVNIATAISPLRGTGLPTVVNTQSPAVISPQNGMLTIGIFPGPGTQSNFNPLNQDASWIADRLLYEPCGFFDPNSGKFEYSLAKSFNFSPDNKVFSFTLRDGLKWSDGSAITAADVIYTYRALLSNQNLDGVATMTLLSDVDHIDRVGQNTVSIYFKEPDAPGAYNLLAQPVINAKSFQQVSLQDLDKFTNPNPVVSGPFMLSQVTTNGITLVINPNFYGSSLKIKGIFFPTFSDRSQFNDAIASNKLALWETTDIVPGSNDSRVIPVYNSELALFFNTNTILFSDLNIRNALSQAIDREALRQIRPGSIQANPGGLLPKDSAFSQSQTGQKWIYSPEQAGKLLDNAGYKTSSNGLRTNPDGSELKLDIQVIDTRQDIAEMVSQDLLKIGITAPVNVVDLRTFYTNLQTGGYKLAVAPVFYSDSYPEAYYFYYQSLSIPPQTQIFTNWSQFHLPVADDLLNQWKNTNDPQDWPAISDKLARLYADNLPSTPLLLGAAYVGFTTVHFSHWPDTIQANLYDDSGLSFLKDLEPSQ